MSMKRDDDVILLASRVEVMVSIPKAGEFKIEVPLDMRKLDIDDDKHNIRGVTAAVKKYVEQRIKAKLKIKILTENPVRRPRGK